MKLKGTFVIVIFIIILVGIALYDAARAWGNTGMFLEIIKPVKGAAGANGGCGMLWGLDSVGINPAGTVGVFGFEVQAEYMNYLNDFKVQRLVFGTRTRLGVFVIDYTSFSSDEFEIRTEESPGGTGEFFSEKDSVASLIYSRRFFFKNLYWGVGVKKMTMKLYEYSASSILYSMGFLFYRDGLGIGVSVINAGGIVQFIQEKEKIPETYRFGLSLRIYQGKGGDLITIFDVIKGKEDDPKFVLGLEFGFIDMFSCNIGYRIDDGENGISAGLGFNLKLKSGIVMMLSTSYSDIGVLGEKNGVSLGIKW